MTFQKIDYHKTFLIINLLLIRYKLIRSSLPTCAQTYLTNCHFFFSVNSYESHCTSLIKHSSVNRIESSVMNTKSTNYYSMKNALVHLSFADSLRSRKGAEKKQMQILK